MSIASTTSRTPSSRMVSVSPCSALTPPMQMNSSSLARKLATSPLSGPSVAGHMDPGIAACAVREPTAGEPAVLPVWSVRVVQPYFQSLYEAVLIPNRNKKAVGTGERPLAVIGAKAGESAQLMPAGAEQVSYQPTAPFRLGHTLISVLSDAFLGQAPL